MKLEKKQLVSSSGKKPTKGRQRVGMPGPGSRLSTYCPTKRSTSRSQHTFADQTPTPCTSVVSPVHVKGGSACALKPGKLNLAFPAKPQNAVC